MGHIFIHQKLNVQPLKTTGLVGLLVVAVLFFGPVEHVDVALEHAGGALEHSDEALRHADEALEHVDGAVLVSFSRADTLSFCSSATRLYDRTPVKKNGSLKCDKKLEVIVKIFLVLKSYTPATDRCPVLAMISCSSKPFWNSVVAVVALNEWFVW